MRYFSDDQLQEMREHARSDYDANDCAEYLAYITKIELLDKRNDTLGDCREELMQAIAEIGKRTEQYVHRGQTNPNDEDADAFEYENY